MFVPGSSARAPGRAPWNLETEVHWGAGARSFEGGRLRGAPRNSTTEAMAGLVADSSWPGSVSQHGLLLWQAEEHAPNARPLPHPPTRCRLGTFAFRRDTVAANQSTNGGRCAVLSRVSVPFNIPTRVGISPARSLRANTARYIPTRVGISNAVKAYSFSSAVHPHARGDFESSTASA